VQTAEVNALGEALAHADKKKYKIIKIVTDSMYVYNGIKEDPIKGKDR